MNKEIDQSYNKILSKYGWDSADRDTDGFFLYEKGFSVTKDKNGNEIPPEEICFGTLRIDMENEIINAYSKEGQEIKIPFTKETMNDAISHITNIDIDRANSILEEQYSPELAKELAFIPVKPEQSIFPNIDQEHIKELKDKISEYDWEDNDNNYIKYYDDMGNYDEAGVILEFNEEKGIAIVNNEIPISLSESPEIFAIKATNAANQYVNELRAEVYRPEALKERSEEIIDIKPYLAENKWQEARQELLEQGYEPSIYTDNGIEKDYGDQTLQFEMNISDRQDPHITVFTEENDVIGTIDIEDDINQIIDNVNSHFESWKQEQSQEQTQTNKKGRSR